jgi:hypothetical protein
MSETDIRVTATEPLDLLGMIVNAILELPAQFIAIYQHSQDQWKLVGLMMAGLLALAWLANRPRRRRRTSRQLARHPADN